MHLTRQYMFAICHSMRYTDYQGKWMAWHNKPAPSKVYSPMITERSDDVRTLTKHIYKYVRSRHNAYKHKKQTSKWFSKTPVPSCMQLWDNTISNYTCNYNFTRSICNILIRRRHHFQSFICFLFQSFPVLWCSYSDQFVSALPHVATKQLSNAVFSDNVMHMSSRGNNAGALQYV